MLDNFAAPGAALALACAFVFAAGAVGIFRTRHAPDQRVGLCVILLVLTLTMAASVTIFRPSQPGDLIDERNGLIQVDLR